MAKPKYLILIHQGEWQVPCLSNQFRIILEECGKYFTADVQCYVSDVLINNSNEKFYEIYNTLVPQFIGNPEELKNWSKQVDQFLSGVFIFTAGKKDTILTREFETEGYVFDDMHEAFLEIRAFDTSYFEIYSSDPSLMQHLAAKFGEEIQLEDRFRQENPRACRPLDITEKLYGNL